MCGDKTRWRDRYDALLVARPGKLGSSDLELISVEGTCGELQRPTGREHSVGGSYGDGLNADPGGKDAIIAACADEQDRRQDGPLTWDATHASVGLRGRPSNQSGLQLSGMLKMHAAVL